MTQARNIKASLYVTCIIDQLYPQVGVSAVRVLRRLGVTVDSPAGQTCCGQPLYNAGFTTPARKLARRVLHSFRDSQYIVVPSGSCAAMMRVFYQELFQEDPQLAPEARELSGKVFEFSEFLVKVLGIDSVDTRYQGSATYHPSCHLLRELGVREEPARLLGNVKDLELVPLPEAETCCGFGGSFAVKYPHISEGMLEDKVRNIVATGAGALVGCDMSCLMHIGGALTRQELDIEVRHLAQVLDRDSPSNVPRPS